LKLLSLVGETQESSLNRLTDGWLFLPLLPLHNANKCYLNSVLARMFSQRRPLLTFPHNAARLCSLGSVGCLSTNWCQSWQFSLASKQSLPVKSIIAADALCRRHCCCFCFPAALFHRHTVLIHYQRSALA